MAKIIKLTRVHQEKEFDIYVNIDYVQWFNDYYHDGKRTCTQVGIKWGVQDLIAVKETPNEIISLINGSANSGPVKGNFVDGMQGFKS